MTRGEFNKKVTQKKKELTKGSAERLFNLFETQHLYRNGGLADRTFNEILTEIAQAQVLDVDLIDGYDITKEIKYL